MYLHSGSGVPLPFNKVLNHYQQKGNYNFWENIRHHFQIKTNTTRLLPYTFTLLDFYVCVYGSIPIVLILRMWYIHGNYALWPLRSLYLTGKVGREGKEKKLVWTCVLAELMHHIPAQQHEPVQLQGNPSGLHTKHTLIFTYEWGYH